VDMLIGEDLGRGCRRPLFFCSSRRRHTRFSRDWSSDVCSSDLKEHMKKIMFFVLFVFVFHTLEVIGQCDSEALSNQCIPKLAARSEERRVGKEGRSRRPGQPSRTRRRTNDSEAV